MPRNIISVINGMKKYVPSDDSFGIIYELEKISDSIVRSAPELVKSNIFWNRISMMLQTRIKEKDYQENLWIRQMIENVFMNENYNDEFK